MSCGKSAFSRNISIYEDSFSHILVLVVIKRLVSFLVAICHALSQQTDGNLREKYNSKLMDINIEEVLDCLSFWSNYRKRPQNREILTDPIVHIKHRRLTSVASRSMCRLDKRVVHGSSPRRGHLFNFFSAIEWSKNLEL